MLLTWIRNASSSFLSVKSDLLLKVNQETFMKLFSEFWLCIGYGCKPIVSVSELKTDSNPVSRKSGLSQATYLTLSSLKSNCILSWGLRKQISASFFTSGLQQKCYIYQPFIGRYLEAITSSFVLNEYSFCSAERQFLTLVAYSAWIVEWCCLKL